MYIIIIVVASYSIIIISSSSSSSSSIKSGFVNPDIQSYSLTVHIAYLVSGELHVPLEVCGAVVKRELDFWQMNESEIKACCWRHYRSYIENQRILDSFDNSLKKEQFNVDLDQMTGWKRFQMKIWLILDHPRTSRTAMVCMDL